MNSPRILNVAVSVPLSREFDYLPAQDGPVIELEERASGNQLGIINGVFVPCMLNIVLTSAIVPYPSSVWRLMIILPRAMWCTWSGPSAWRHQRA